MLVAGSLTLSLRALVGGEFRVGGPRYDMHEGGECASEMEHQRVENLRMRWMPSATY